VATDMMSMLIDATNELKELQPLDPSNMPDLSGIIGKLQAVTTLLVEAQKWPQQKT
jgi:hypothetical protein